MSMATGAKTQYAAGSWMEAFHDVYVGTITGATHSIYLVQKWWWINVFRPILRMFGFRLESQEEIRQQQLKDADKQLKVVAVGYGRTGTYSLTLALNELGFNTLHTQHLYENEAILDMWTNKIFLPSIENKKIDMGKPDFQLIADHGYQATADLPMALYFEEIAQQFPDCKFVLTTKSSSEDWFRSWDTLTRSITQAVHVGRFAFTSVNKYSHYFRWLYTVVNDDESYLEVPFPLPPQNREAAIASYEAHNRRVREVIPKDRLLEYHVKEGWGPLCQFLEISDCPTTPFPKTNSARSVQVQTISAQITPIFCALVCIFYAFATTFKFLTGMTVVDWANWKSRELMYTLRRVMLHEHDDCGPIVRKKT